MVTQPWLASSDGEATFGGESSTFSTNVYVTINLGTLRFAYIAISTTIAAARAYATCFFEKCSRSFRI